MDKPFFAPAKINLSLEIMGRRDDGYHILNTLIAFTNLGDHVRIVKAPAYKLIVDGPYAAHAPADETNLVTRAVRAMEKTCGRTADIEVRLTKSIPAGAGMGGGASGCAIVLKVLNSMWETPLNISQLQNLGLQLGAELPVCMRAPGNFRVTGIGEGMLRERLANRITGIVVWPGIVLSTGAVFAEYKGEKHEQNDLTEAAMRLTPKIGEAMETLKSIGCTSVGMSGAGSSVFGSCEGGWEKAAKLAASHPDWWVKSFIINP